MAGDTGYTTCTSVNESRTNGETHSAYTVLSQLVVPSGIHYQGSV